MKKLLLSLLLTLNVSHAADDYMSKTPGGWTPVYYADVANVFRGLKGVAALKGDLRVSNVGGAAAAKYVGDEPKSFKVTWGGSIYPKPNNKLDFTVCVNDRPFGGMPTIIAPSEQRWISLSIDQIVYLRPGDEVAIKVRPSMEDKIVVQGSFNIFSLD